MNSSNMSKWWEPSVTLIATGIIIPDLHFGPFLRNWWYVKTIQENGMKVEQYYPFRVGMKMRVELKKQIFIIRVVQGNKHSDLLPGFLCESLLESNEEVKMMLFQNFTKEYFKLKCAFLEYW
jgi:hypothetical protein